LVDLGQAGRADQLHQLGHRPHASRSDEMSGRAAAGRLPGHARQLVNPAGQAPSTRWPQLPRSCSDRRRIHHWNRPAHGRGRRPRHPRRTDHDPAQLTPIKTAAPPPGKVAAASTQGHGRSQPVQSRLHEPGPPLADHLRRNPELLGDRDVRPAPRRTPAQSSIGSSAPVPRCAAAPTAATAWARQHSVPERFGRPVWPPQSRT
jgi:hypothetical protein